MNRIIHAVADSGIKDINAKAIVRVVLERCPDALSGFKALLV